MSSGDFIGYSFGDQRQEQPAARPVAILAFERLGLLASLFNCFVILLFVAMHPHHRDFANTAARNGWAKLYLYAYAVLFLFASFGGCFKFGLLTFKTISMLAETGLITASLICLGSNSARLWFRAPPS